MREIKFRAWDRLGNKMIYQESDTTELRFNYPYPDNKKEYFPFYQIDLIQMQYTGLKDKNGKEIYEGDILDGLSVIRFGEVKTYDYMGSIFGWYAKVTQKLKENPNSYAKDIINTNKRKVIGNIYENPELLI